VVSIHACYFLSGFPANSPNANRESIGNGRNVPIGKTVPTDGERHFHRTFCWAVLGAGPSGIRGDEIAYRLAGRELLISLVGLNRP